MFLVHLNILKTELFDIAYSDSKQSAYSLSHYTRLWFARDAWRYINVYWLILIDFVDRKHNIPTGSTVQT